MVPFALVLTLGGVVFALLIAAVVYLVGVYLFHGPIRIVGLIAFLLFLLLLFGGASINLH